MPSVVNISTTTTVVTNSNPFPGFQFPPGSPFEDMFKEFGTPQTRKSAALGSGFIIEKSGIVVTNNHVIQNAFCITWLLVTTIPLFSIIKPEPSAADFLVCGVPNSLNISSKGEPGGN